MTLLRYLVSMICVMLILFLSSSRGQDTTAKKSYSETPFNLTVDRLPTNYRGNDADSIYRLIERRENSQIKGDFETTQQYQTRVGHQNAQPLIGSLLTTSLFAFEAAELEFRYDADSGVMDLHVPTSAAMDDVVLDTSRLALRVQASTSFRSYLGSNAFGVKVWVREKDVKSIDIGVVNASEFELEKDDTDADCFHGELHLAPEEARRLKQSARVLVIGSLPASADSDQTKLAPGKILFVNHQRPIGKGVLLGDATIENPTAFFEQIRYVNMRVLEIWIYSPKTGTILLKIKPKSVHL